MHSPASPEAIESARLALIDEIVRFVKDIAAHTGNKHVAASTLSARFGKRGTRFGPFAELLNTAVAQGKLQFVMEGKFGKRMFFTPYTEEESARENIKFVIDTANKAIRMKLWDYFCELEMKGPITPNTVELVGARCEELERAYKSGTMLNMS